MKASTEKTVYIAGGVFFLMLLGVALLTKKPVAAESYRSLNQVVSSGKLRVVSENSSNGISVEDGNTSGFQYEILKAFADTLGVELDISLNNDLKACIVELNKGKYDIIAKFIPVTTEWLDTISFSKPLLTSRQMLVQQIHEGKKQGDIEYQYQLANDSIVISLHSPHKMRLKNLSDEIADTIYIVELENMNPEQLVALVSEGKIQNTICYEQLSRKLIRKYPNIDASLPVSQSQSYSWIVNKQSAELLERLNEFLSGFIESGAYWDLYGKYY